MRERNRRTQWSETNTETAPARIYGKNANEWWMIQKTKKRKMERKGEENADKKMRKIPKKSKIRIILR